MEIEELEEGLSNMVFNFCLLNFKHTSIDVIIIRKGLYENIGVMYNIINNDFENI